MHAVRKYHGYAVRIAPTADNPDTEKPIMGKNESETNHGTGDDFFVSDSILSQR